MGTIICHFHTDSSLIFQLLRLDCWVFGLKINLSAGRKLRVPDGPAYHCRARHNYSPDWNIHVSQKCMDLILQHFSAVIDHVNVEFGFHLYYSPHTRCPKKVDCFFLQYKWVNANEFEIYLINNKYTPSSSDLHYNHIERAHLYHSMRIIFISSLLLLVCSGTSCLIASQIRLVCHL